MKFMNSAQKTKRAAASRQLSVVASVALTVFTLAPSQFALAQDGAATSFEFFVPDEGQDIGGIYWLKSSSAAIKTTDGGDPPYTPEAMAIYQERRRRR